MVSSAHALFCYHCIRLVEHIPVLSVVSLQRDDLARLVLLIDFVMGMGDEGTEGTSEIPQRCLAIAHKDHVAYTKLGGVEVDVKCMVVRTDAHQGNVVTICNSHSEVHRITMRYWSGTLAFLCGQLVNKVLDRTEVDEGYKCG